MDVKRLLLVLLVVLAALVGPSAARPLIGGEETGPTSYTNVGAFGVVVKGEFLEVCSGTLVAPTAVLTAGHCTVYFGQLEDTGYDVVFTLDPSPTASSTFYDATAFYTHPDYVDRLNGNSKCGLYGQCTTDVGIAELAIAPSGVAAPTIAPIGYVDTLDLKTQTFSTVGYGIEGFANANTPLGPNGGTRKVGTFEALGQDVTAARFLSSRSALPHRDLLWRLGRACVRERIPRGRRLVWAELRVRFERVLHPPRYHQCLELDHDDTRRDRQSHLTHPAAGWTMRERRIACALLSLLSSRRAANWARSHSDARSRAPAAATRSSRSSSVTSTWDSDAATPPLRRSCRSAVEGRLGCGQCPRHLTSRVAFIAAAMERDPPAEAPLVCAECGRLPRDGENAADEWRAYRGRRRRPAGVLPGVRRARVREQSSPPPGARARRRGARLLGRPEKHCCFCQRGPLAGGEGPVPLVGRAYGAGRPNRGRGRGCGVRPLPRPAERFPLPAS